MSYRAQAGAGTSTLASRQTTYARTAPGVVRPSRRTLPSAVGGPGKRALDLLLVLLLVPLVLPLAAGVALMIRLDGPGPVLFGHERVGRGGRRFRCWKFRTMVVDGDRVLEEHFRRNPADLALWRAERKLPDDPRVTPLGAVLRRLSLDELPQLWNVLAGDMSLVGPRPVVADELENYGPSARHYLRARPGLTGLWQVSGRNDVSYRERVHLDRLYVRDWSLPLDVWILVRTVPAVVRSRGAR